jgi:hypothetical protein
MRVRAAALRIRSSGQDFGGRPDADRSSPSRRWPIISPAQRLLPVKLGFSVETLTLAGGTLQRVSGDLNVSR